MKTDNKKPFRLSGYITLVLMLAVLLTFSAFNFRTEENADHKYVGVTKCVGACHKTEAQGKQLDIWKNSAHANAWKTLETEEANKIAKEKGFDKPAVEVPECVKCHVLSKEINPDELAETFDKTEGVQCESCHGPGSDYMKLSIMKDRQKSIENGLFIPQNKEEFCTGCHNDQSPTFKGFDYESYWAKIQHYKPESK